MLELREIIELERPNKLKYPGGYVGIAKNQHHVYYIIGTIGMHMSEWYFVNDVPSSYLTSTK